MHLQEAAWLNSVSRKMLVLQGPASMQSPTVARMGYSSNISPAAAAPGGAKDPFADLSAFH